MTSHLQQQRALTAQRVFLASDLAALVASFYLSYRLFPFYRPYFRPVVGVIHLGPFRESAWPLLLILPVWFVFLKSAGLYSPLRFSWSFYFWRLLRVHAAGLSSLAVVIFAFKLEDIGRLIVFGFLAISVPLLLGSRFLVLVAFRAHQSHIYSIPRVLVIGSRNRARDFVRRARHMEDIRYEVVGCLEPDPTKVHDEVEGVPVLGTTEIFRQYVFERPVDIVVLAMPLEKLPNAKGLVEGALELGLRVMVCPDFYFEHLGYSLEDSHVSVESCFGMPMPVFSTVRQEGSYLLLKRVLDVGVSGVLLVLLSPLFLIIAALIKLTSPDGPVVYSSTLVGLNKKTFVGYKFRTMVPNADELKAQLRAHNEMTGPVFKMRNDPRVTAIGRILRKYSLDELPQLYSVLKGDMSLVGPRPNSEYDAERFEFWQRRKLSVKPGITCLWQVKGRSEIKDFAEWARLDIEYIQNASFWFDLKVLFKTIPVVLLGKGAY